jgi:hypothetical protein
MDAKMRYADDDLFEGFETELFRIPSIKDAVDFPMEDRELVFWAHSLTWYSFPKKLRRHFIENGELQEHVIRNFLAGWVADVGAFEAKIAPLRITAIDPSIEEKLKDRLKPDVEALWKVAPRLERIWTF